MYTDYAHVWIKCIMCTEKITTPTTTNNNKIIFKHVTYTTHEKKKKKKHVEGKINFCQISLVHRNKKKYIGKSIILIKQVDLMAHFCLTFFGTTPKPLSVFFLFYTHIHLQINNQLPT